VVLINFVVFHHYLNNNKVKELLVDLLKYFFHFEKYNK